MAFPQTVLPLKVELDLGGWTDVTSYVRREGGSGISITRGRANESAQTERTQASFTLDNRDGRFSERNPTGPYYELLSLNTPCRISLPRTTKVLEVAHDTDPLLGNSSWLSCPDAATLDITGDLDVRVDVHLHDWTTNVVLASKTDGFSSASWDFTVFEGCLRFGWSTNGGTSSDVKRNYRSTVRVPITTGRLAVRATLDVNNGASGHTVTFYTSDTLSGTWTQLGSAVVGSGTTSIHAGTQGIRVAAGNVEGYEWYFYGWVYGFQLRNGIGGTIVANPDPTAQAVGATSFADTAGTPNTWTVAGNALITDRYWRFHGEISSWPQTWDRARRDVTVSAVAAGPIRRLTQGASPLRSAAFRYLSLPHDYQAFEEEVPIAYWPCEDIEGSTVIASGLVGGSPMQLSGGSPTFSSYSEFPGSAGLPSTNGEQWTGQVPAYTNPGDYAEIEFMFHVPADGLPAISDVFTAKNTSADVPTWRMIYGTSDGGRLSLYGYDNTNTEVFGAGYITNINGKNLRVRVRTQDIDWQIIATDLSDSTVTNVAHSPAGNMGSWTQININPLNQMNGAVIGHIIVRTGEAATANSLAAVLGHAGETTWNRFARLCDEEGLPARFIGEQSTSALMGAQRPVELIGLLRECADAEMGMMFEPLDVLGLGLRTRTSLENQTAGLTVDYAANELAEPPIPTSDDQDVRNDITVTRTGGSSARAELTSGRMSTAAPPDGVGRYAEGATFNLYQDGQLATVAGYRLAQRSADEDRHPRVTISRTTPAIVANSGVNSELLTLLPGNILAIDNMPAPYVAPGQTRQLIQGWTERLANFEHWFDFNCSPGSPWYFGVVEDESYGQIDTDNSVLAAAVDSDDTSLLVTSVEGQYWTEDPANMPFDVLVSGEAITVTGIGSGIFDTFTRSTSNGWGSATSGQAWTRSGGDAADYSVNGSAGVIDVDTVSSERWVTLAQTATAWDVEMRSRTLVLAATQPINTYIGAMLTGTSEGYIARMAFYNGATVRLSIERMPFAMLAAEITIPGLTHAANSWFRLRFRVQDGLLQAKAWADGSAEPPGWHLTAYDTTYTSGGMGVRTVLTSGNTNTLPVAVQYDDIATHNPQLFTVTRSANDVTKSQVTGADLRLRYPTILSL